jgi:hypothetical protein
MAGLTRIKSDGIGDNCDLDGEGTLVLDSTNNRVGIGTSSPTKLLQLNQSDSTSSAVHFTNSTTGATASDGLTVGIGANEQAQFWLAENNYMRFATNNSEAVRITSSGNVGIGTSAPSSLLHLAANAPYITFEDKDNNQDWQLQATAWFAIRDQTSNAERLRIDSSGRVGIASGSQDLSVFNANGSQDLVVYSKGTSGLNAHAGITLLGQSTTASQCSISFADGTGGAQRYAGSIDYFHSNDSMSFRTGSVGSRMVIDSSGNVGIGTTSPTEKLHVAGNAILKGTNSYIGLQNASGTSTGYIQGQSGFLVIAGGSGSSNTIAFYPQNTEAMRIDSSGRLLVGTTTAGYSGADEFTIASSGSTGMSIRSTSSTVGAIYFADGTTTTQNYQGIIQYKHSNDSLQFYTNYAGNSSARMEIDSSGNLQVPTGQFTVGTTASTGLQFINDGTFGTLNSIPLVFRTVSGERMRIDTSGRLLVGTSTNFDSSANIQAQGNGLALKRDITDSGVNNGLISFYSGAGLTAYIYGLNDGVQSTGDTPGALVFATTADGASSPTVRMRIANNGDTFFTKTSDVFNTPGFRIAASGLIEATVNAGGCLNLNRMSDDGGLVGFYQNGVAEGNIDVNGTTVSYNGAHLSRWSQLAGGAERIEILRGSVLSNLDEMCEWGEEDNEQLNRMKVSDVEGDRNVSGVFQSWDDDDDTYTNDFYCAMTGDFVIRIAQGTTVARGDLLMSAGDGTAKPQDDDIVRSKTIAKVTSTTVSTTYSDNSYCVPCVLMAC